MQTARFSFAAVLLVGTLLAAAACQPAAPPYPAPGEAAPDDIMLTPGGLAYRANSYQAGVTNPWQPIEMRTLSLGSGPDDPRVTYRDHIETRAGEARNNIVIAATPGRLGSTFDVYVTALPVGIDVEPGRRWSGPGKINQVLIVEASLEVEPGQYTFEIGLVVDGKDYGTVPCTVEVTEGG